MKELLLIGHIAIAIVAVLAGIVGLATKGQVKEKAQKLFTPSVILIVASGAGLVVAGASLTHACISGVVTISALYILRALSAKSPDTIEI